ncbi:uncharacterized protein BYT42DRAFT_483301, partial [Radiomyces spectabilis]|uniref:uncharacterized protein n=1 Tax=Radiomyces spectabilis TaxID=64574 RepID=UPI00221E6247
LSLQDLIDASPKSEELLEALTADQIQLIQETITKVKKRKLEKTKEAEDRAAAIASALAAAVTRHEQTSHVQDGTEWLSFVYSHNRTMKRYSIRTDINNVSLDIMSDTFKAENCVYPRANLPQEQYRGNRWNYETECNLLGWKLAWVNADEIAGKRGLIQRAVDSYRNRYPSMRSRRVARQAKLMNGTLRKRKQREESVEDISMSTTVTHQPKTITIEDGANRIRIKIGIEHVNLNEITPEFRQCNCVYPRAMALRSDQAVGLYMRWMEEVKCNEMGWKLAWLNPRHLANKKNLLQRALDTYRSKFMPELRPRKHSSRSPPVSLGPAVLTTDNLRTLQAMDQKITSPTMSCGSGTTESLDFGDCFS